MIKYNPDLDHDVYKEILVLLDYLDSMATKAGTNVIVTSMRRNPKPGQNHSWHHDGKAIDFCFENSNMFKWISELYNLAAAQKGAFAGVTQIELCRGVINGQWQNHCHLAFGNEPVLKSFTGVY